MNDARTVKGFLVGALVAGAIAAAFITSKEPAPSAAPVAPMAAPAMPPMASPPFAPPMPSQPASPREAADELFNAAMMAAERNDQATLARVLPGAMAAYRALSPLDGDGSFHLAALELTGGRFSEARATCAAVLTTNPKHLLALGVSLRAAERAGDTAAARGFAQRLLEAYDGEASRPLPEYQDHQRMLPAYRAEAMAALK
ncbi:MAG: hypothetical protein JNJ54_07990 [Myxococcaceae bacterium]|nr:hypothetical protein [Myxococcaceae bacterium]